MIAAVLFDLFETLVTEYDPDYDASEREPLARLFGDRLEQFEDRWRRTRQERHAGHTGGFRDLVVAACQDMDIIPDPALVREANARRIARKAIPFKTVDPEVAAMVDGLKTAGLPMGVLSNCDREEILAWPQWKPSSGFSAAVFSCQVGMVKPDPQIYRIACKQLGVPAAQTLYVADGAHREIQGAAEAGLQTACCTWFTDRWPIDLARDPGGAPVLTAPSQVNAMVQRAGQADPP